MHCFYVMWLGKCKDYSGADVGEGSRVCATPPSWDDLALSKIHSILPKKTPQLSAFLGVHPHLRKILDLPPLLHQWKSSEIETGNKECPCISGLGNCFRILLIFQTSLSLYIYWAILLLMSLQGTINCWITIQHGPRTSTRWSLWWKGERTTCALSQI